MKAQDKPTEDPRIERILDAIVKLASGDPGPRLAASEGGDRLDAATAALDALSKELADGRVRREKVGRRLAEIQDVVMAMARLEFERTAPAGQAADELDAVAAGLNMLGEELQASTVSREHLESVLQSMVDMLFVAGPDGTIRTVNEAACTVLGYCREELTGRGIDSLFAAAEAGFGGRLAELVSEGSARNLEVVLEAKDGTPIPVMVNGSATRGAEGKLEAVVVAARDMREMRILAAKAEAEEAARRAAQRWVGTFDAIEDAVFIVDRERRVVRANRAAKRLGGEELVGRLCCDAIHGSQAPPPGCPNCRVFDAGQSGRFEHKEPHLGDRWYDFFVWPIKDENGIAVELIHIVRDITARKRAEEKLARQAAELLQSKRRLQHEIADKNDFLRTVSHDMGAPLRNIMGMVDSINRRHGDDLPEEVKDRLARVRRNAESEMSLIGELLDLSRIRTRRQAIAEVNVGDVVRDATDRVAEELEAKGVRLVLDEEWPVLWCERARLAQVFQNLVDNAVKYMGEREDAHIEVGWREEPGRYVFHVKDNGAGIAPEDMVNLFHVFRRGKSAATQAEGKGVGLAAVKAIAGTYDGEAWVDSEAGKGSTFIFSLAKARVKRDAQAASGADLPAE
jgi:PAS domain S-box-containing protein